MPTAMSVANRFSRVVLAVLTSSFLILACQPSQQSPDLVATSSLGDIHFGELEQYILSLPENRRSPPADKTVVEWHQFMLEGLISEQALAAEAAEMGLAESPEGSAYLARQIEPALRQAIATRMISERVAITDEHLRAFYDAHPEEFSHPDQIRVRNIYRRVARDAPPEVWAAAREEIQALLDEIRRGADFGELARAHSDSETASLQGLIGRLDRGKMQPELEEILWALDEGEVSEVIRTPVGFQIFKVDAHVGDFKMDFDDARTRLHRRLTREATEAAEIAILEELLAASGATYEPERLEDGDPEEVLFSMEDQSLTIADFHARLDSVGFSAAREVSTRQQLDTAVRDRLYLWEAEASGLADEPAVAAGIEQIERDAMVALAIQERAREVAGTLDEDELRASFESNIERYQTPRLLRLRILTSEFPAEETSWYSLYEELERLAVEIRGGRRDFADAARELSTDYTAGRGGDVGVIRPDAVADWAGPQAQRKVLELPPDGISEPILIERYNSNRLTYDRSGFALVHLINIDEPRERSYDEVREIVVERYLEEHNAEILDQIRQDVLRSVDAEIITENL